MLIAPDVIRQQQAVQNFDHTQKLAEYGFTIGTLADLEKAKEVVRGLVSNAETLINDLITACRELDQNPYKASVKANGKDVKYALEVPLFSEGELRTRLDKEFARERSRLANMPNVSVIAAKVRTEIQKLADESGFEVMAIEVARDESPTRIVLRDPEYVREAAAREPKPAPPPAIDEVGALLAQPLQRVELSLSRTELGCPDGMPAETVRTVAAAASQIVEEAAVKVAAHVASSRQSQLSPFDQQPALLHGEILFCDNRFVRRRGLKRYVDRPVSITVATNHGIASRLTDLVGHDTAGLVDSSTFRAFVNQAIARRLQAVSGLPLASVSYHGGYHENLLRVLLTDPALAGRNFVQRLLPWPPPPPKQVLALPPPQPPATIGPVALPGVTPRIADADQP